MCLGIHRDLLTLWRGGISLPASVRSDPLPIRIQILQRRMKCTLLVGRGGNLRLACFRSGMFVRGERRFCIVLVVTIETDIVNGRSLPQGNRLLFLAKRHSNQTPPTMQEKNHRVLLSSSAVEPTPNNLRLFQSLSNTFAHVCGSGRWSSLESALSIQPVIPTSLTTSFQSFP